MRAHRRLAGAQRGEPLTRASGQAQGVALSNTVQVPKITGKMGPSACCGAQAKCPPSFACVNLA
jgi:hypothetical protein